jgi:hypothetical protein
MTPWFCVYYTCSEFGTYCQISFYETDEDGKHVKQWEHQIQVSEATEVPREELSVWASTMARTVSRYFEDRVIEEIRARVATPSGDSAEVIPETGVSVPEE